MNTPNKDTLEDRLSRFYRKTKYALKTTALAAAFSLICSQSDAKNVTWGWNPSSGATGYLFCSGVEPGVYNEIDVGNVTQFTLDMPLNTNFVSAKAYNNDAQSDYANEVAIYIYPDNGGISYIIHPLQNPKWQMEDDALYVQLNTSGLASLTSSYNKGFATVVMPMSAWNHGENVLAIYTQNAGSPKSLDVTIEDKNQKKAFYYHKTGYLNLPAQKNTSIVKVNEPDVADSGFDDLSIEKIYVTVNTNKSLTLGGTERLNILGLELMMGGIDLTGQFSKGVNAYSAGNHSDFGNTDNQNDLSAIGTDRLNKTATYNTTLNKPFTGEENELIMMFNLTSTQLSRLPLSNEVMRVTIGSTSYIVNRSEVVEGWNLVRKEIITPIQNGNQASVKILDRSTYSPTTPTKKLDGLYMFVR